MPTHEDTISRHIVEAAIEVQRVLGGPGALESIYEEALAYELRLRGLKVERQVGVPVFYKARQLTTSLRIDLLVDDCVIVECKVAKVVHDSFIAQALTYLRITSRRLALVINFGQRPLRQGIRRVVNSLPDLLQAR